jgi:hypothetical protein
LQVIEKKGCDKSRSLIDIFSYVDLAIINMKRIFLLVPGLYQTWPFHFFLHFFSFANILVQNDSKATINLTNNQC